MARCYILTYCEGTNREVTADTYTADSEDVVFYLDGGEVLREPSGKLLMIDQRESIAESPEPDFTA